ncbi:Oidioi.mRNA.OKI2018_I69.XSR.g13885.t3.cds [Oikopleura dioica]|uniref:Oidioi.mRNA.OKI2018_I69.XSR.g13885.t3.cds n=1 Tax=Oikopleura dioica TaxID=34765 RepID=A0ABN7S8N3_OIKDI|nr:Oidioi.mRNA.OKI2018_I69.XSR.g13885.t3.cds [Oikopleura dioica]
MKEEEDIFRQSSSICVNYCGKAVKVSDLTRRSTVTQVIRKLVKQLSLHNETSWEIVEEWRGTERPLPTRTRLLKVWHAWSSEQVHVSFRLQLSSKRSASYRHRRRHRHSVREGQRRYISEWSESESSESSDSFLSDSIVSDSSTESESDCELVLRSRKKTTPQVDLAAERKKQIELIQSQQISLAAMAKTEAQLNASIETQLAKIEAGAKQEGLITALGSSYKLIASIEERLAPLKKEIIELNSQISELTSNSSENSAVLQLRAAIDAQIEITKRLDDEAEELAAAQHDLAECVEDREHFLLDSIHNASGNQQVSRDSNPPRMLESEKSSNSSSEDADDEWSMGRLSSYDENVEKKHTSKMETSGAYGRVKPVYSTSTTCSDSGHVSDGSDSKNGSADRFSFTDSAIDSSTECKAKLRSNCHVESDSDSVRLNYVQQLRQSSLIIRSTSIRLSREARRQNSSLQKARETSPSKKASSQKQPEKTKTAAKENPLRTEKNSKGKCQIASPTNIYAIEKVFSEKFQGIEGRRFGRHGTAKRKKRFTFDFNPYFENSSFEPVPKEVERKEADERILVEDEWTVRNSSTFRIEDHCYVNPALSLTVDDFEMASYEGLSRVVEIKRKKKKDPLGFKVAYIPDRKGNVFTAVTEGSISAQCGLLAGDRALSIDGKNVEKLDHQKFVDTLKKTKTNIKLGVIGYQVDPVNPARDAEAADLGFKICVLKKEGKGYGFSLNTNPGSTEGTSEHVLQKVAPGGAADKAGVSDGMHLIAINGVDLTSKSHAEIVNIVKKGGSTLVVKVKTGPKKEEDERSEMAESEIAAAKSVAPVEKASTNLHESFASCEAPAPITASRSFSIKKLEKVLLLIIWAVNSKSIVGLSHSEVVSLIRTHQNHVVFLVTSLAAHDQFVADGTEPDASQATLAWEADYGNFGIPRNLLVEKQPDVKYGFNLTYKSHTHAITVNPGSPAEAAGFQNGDIVCAINGADVEGLSHSDAMTHAKVHDNHIEMTVIDPAALKLFQKLGIKITTELAELLASFKIIKRQLSEPPQYEEATAPEPEPEEEEPEPEAEEPEPEPEEESDRLVEHPALAAAAIAKARADSDGPAPLPRLVTLKDNNGYGFFLQDKDGGHYLTDVEEGEAAQLAGVLDNDRIVEVNNKNVEGAKHSTVVDLIRQHTDHVTFLVVDKECDDYYKERDVKITKALLGIEPRARLIRVKKAEGTFGFEMHTEPSELGRVQLLRNIVVGGPAAQAGLEEHDRVLEINGQTLDDVSHEDAVDIIRNSGDTVVFLVADEECLAFFAAKSITITPILKEAEPEPEVDFEEPEPEPSVNGDSVAESVPEPDSEPEPEAPKVPEAVTAAAATVSTITTEKTVALKEEPDVSAGLTVAMARQMKIFGTVKSFKVNPRARVNDQVPLVDRTPTPQPAYSAPTPVAPPAPKPVHVKPAAAAAVVVNSSQPQTSKPRAPAGASIAALMNRFQQNGQVLTGGQMPEQGVPEQQSVKIVAAKATVDGSATAGAIGVAVKQQPKSPEPVVNKVMRPNISEVNKMANGQVAPAAPMQPTQMYGQPQYQQPQQPFQQYPMYPQSPQGGYQPFPVQPFAPYGAPQPQYGAPQPGFMPYMNQMPPQQGFYPPPPPQQQQQQQPQYR